MRQFTKCMMHFEVIVALSNQYIANKPAKYGIKMYALINARTFYTYDMVIYWGKQPEEPHQLSNDASSVVKQ